MWCFHSLRPRCKPTWGRAGLCLGATANEEGDRSVEVEDLLRDACGEANGASDDEVEGIQTYVGVAAGCRQRQ